MNESCLFNSYNFHSLETNTKKKFSFFSFLFDKYFSRPMRHHYLNMSHKKVHMVESIILVARVNHFKINVPLMILTINIFLVMQCHLELKGAYLQSLCAMRYIVCINDESITKNIFVVCHHTNNNKCVNESSTNTM